MHTLTIGGTAEGKTHSLGQRYRKAREDGATVWSYATGGDTHHAHFRYAEWCITGEHLPVFLGDALSFVESRQRLGPYHDRIVPVRILIDNPPSDVYQDATTCRTLMKLAIEANVSMVQIHLTVSPGALLCVPGELRAQFTEVDLRK